MKVRFLFIEVNFRYLSEFSQVSLNVSLAFKIYFLAVIAASMS